MKVYELIKSLNSKVEISDTLIMDIKKHYLSLYRAYMIYMYDMGYISDPTVFNKKEILSNIVDMNIKYLSGISGKIELSEDNIGYALSRYRGDKEVADFLLLLLSIVKYKDICDNIDKFYEEMGYSSECSKKVSMGLVQLVSRIMVKGGYIIDEGILKCFKGKDKCFEFISMNDIIYEVALKELGLEDNSDESLFVKGLTREEEIRYSNLILNGLVGLDGKYADKLVSWLQENKWSGENKFSSKNEGLYNWVVHVKSNDMLERQSEFLNRLIDNGYNIACMLSNGFYVFKEEKDYIFPVGVFSVRGDSDEGDLLPDINKMEGYTGEVYSLNYLVSNNISFVGCPILLYVDDKNLDYFFDKEQTELKDSISWFKYMGVNISFGDSTYEVGVFPEGSIEDKLYKLVGDSEEGALIGMLEADKKSLAKAKKSVAIKL